MKKKAFGLLVLLLAAAFMVMPACDSGGGSGGSSTGFVAGTYIGTLSGGGTGTYSMVMVVKQNDININGTISLNAGALTGNFTGTVSNANAAGTTQFAWVITASGTTYMFVGTYDGVRIHGTWTNLATSKTGVFDVHK